MVVPAYLSHGKVHTALSLWTRGGIGGKNPIVIKVILIEILPSVHETWYQSIAIILSTTYHFIWDEMADGTSVHETWYQSIAIILSTTCHFIWDEMADGTQRGFLHPSLQHIAQRCRTWPERNQSSLRNSFVSTHPSCAVHRLNSFLTGYWLNRSVVRFPGSISGSSLNFIFIWELVHELNGYRK